MTFSAQDKLISLLNSASEPFFSHVETGASLLEKIGDKRFVLIGEATHGTQEFYQARAAITKELILQKSFMGVAIEGDWPDAYAIHRYLQGGGEAANSEHALANFTRFPRWMWRNTVMPPFLSWLRTHNDNIKNPAHKIGFYGLDLYSMHASMQAVIQYLEKIDPAEAKRACLRYACFDHVKTDPQTYGYLATMGLKKPCVNEAVEQLLELQAHAMDYLKKDSINAAEEHFYATQNARVVKNAEKYYRLMFAGHVSSWNLRDTHMVETFNMIAGHLENRWQRPAKIVIWAHNSHVGDARATEMSQRDEVNIGQLIREQHDNDTYIIGFSTYNGTVTAASDWDNPAECKQINPGFESSYEALFHQMRYKNFLLDLNNRELEHYLKIPRLQRAIGVIYRPDTERISHYFFSRLPYQFDCLIHLDKTTALEPLDINPEWKR